MSLALSFLAQQPSGDPAVVRLFLCQEPTANEVPGLDRLDLGKRHEDAPTRFPRDGDPVKRALVGIEGKQGGWSVGLRRRMFQEEHDLVRTDVELLDSDPGSCEHGVVVGSDVNVPGAPNAVTNGETDLAGVAVEVEG